MIEVDHTDLSNLEPLDPDPAKPILASQLLDLEKKQRKRFTAQGRPEKISTGCGEIDEILGKGCERGIVIGVSAESGEGRLVCVLSLICKRKSTTIALKSVWTKWPEASLKCPKDIAAPSIFVLSKLCLSPFPGVLLQYFQILPGVLETNSRASDFTAPSSIDSSFPP
jgi:hypothetical protein